MLRNIILISILLTVTLAILSIDKDVDISNEENSLEESKVWKHKFGPRGRHPHHHRHHHRHHGPPFLRNVTWEARREFYKIVFNRDSTKAQIKDNVKQWAEKNHIQDEVAAFYAKIKQFFIDHNKNVTAAIGQLEKAHSDVVTIFKDQSLTHHQTFEKIHELLKGYSPELRSLLFATRPRFHGRHHGGHRYGPMDRIDGKDGFRGFGPQIPSNTVDEVDGIESNDITDEMSQPMEFVM